MCRLEIQSRSRWSPSQLSCDGIVCVWMYVQPVLTITEMCSRCMCSCRTRGGSRTVGCVTCDSCSELLMDTWKYSVPFSSHCCFQCTWEMSAPVPDISVRHGETETLISHNNSHAPDSFNCYECDNSKQNKGKNRPGEMWFMLIFTICKMQNEKYINNASWSFRMDMCDSIWTSLRQSLTSNEELLWHPDQVIHFPNFKHVFQSIKRQ